MTPETGNSVSVDTAKTVLVPVEEYEKGTEEAFLRFNGMARAAGETAVASGERDGIVAVMAVPGGTWGPLKDKYEKGEAVVTSPLLDVAGEGWGRHKHDVNILLTADNVYIAVWEEGDLRMAEAFPDNSVDSILYCLQVMGRNFRLRKFNINISGSRAGLVADALRHYYKKVKVTDPCV